MSPVGSITATSWPYRGLTCEPQGDDRGRAEQVHSDLRPPQRRTLRPDHSSAGTHRPVHSTAVASVSSGIDLNGTPQVTPVEVGPERIQKDHLGVRRLPQEEVAGPLLTG